MSPFKLTHLFSACGLLCALLMTSCGSGSPGPASPFAPTAFGGNLPGSTAGATISGTARLSGSSSSGASLMTALGPSVLVVRVVGTQLEAAVDASGRFTLEGVPSGDVQLHFEGSGINATLTLPSVQADQTVIIVVVLAGNSAALESRDDDSADDDSADDDATDDDSEDDDSADDDSADDNHSEDDDSADDDSADDDDSEDDDSKD